jgi:transcriptional regulator with XRE-family HTH domain
LIQGVSNIRMMGKPITHREVLLKFGDKLQKVRKSKGISQEELAAKLAMHRTYVGMIERGERNPTIRTLYKIAKALKVSASELLPF